MKRYLISSAAVLMAALMLTTPTFADVEQSKYFVDMNSQSYGFWAIDEVDELYTSGVVKGVGDNKFAPANLMERGDFALMLENAFKYPTISERKYNFTDVQTEDYYFTAINNTRGNGIVEDSPIFYPQQPIKRVDAFRWIYNTMNLYGCVGGNGSTDISMYTDGNLLLNTKDKIAVGTITKLGIISGYNGQLKPNDTVTRAEMAVMLSKAVEVYKANGSKEANTGTKQELKPVLSGAQANPDPDRSAETPEKITSAYVVEDGESAEIDGAEIAVSEDSGVVARGKGTTLTIDGSKASTNVNGSVVVSVEDGAEAELKEMDINVSAKEADGVYVDNDSQVSIESSNIFTRYEDSRAVESRGSLDIIDTTLQAAKNEAVKLYGGTDTNITDSTVICEGESSGIVIADNGNYDKATLNLDGVDFKGGSKGAAILVDNAVAVINFKNVALDGMKTLIETQYKYSRGVKETDITLNLDNQKLEGEIKGDDMSVITLKLTNGSHYTGVINYANNIKSMNIEISRDSVLELTDDCYFDAFYIDDEDLRRDRFFDEIIDDNGATIYYNADNHQNDYLDDGFYSLPNGGTLRPYNFED